MARPRADLAILLAAGVLVAAFIASFAGGFSWSGLTGRSATRARDEMPVDPAVPRAEGRVEVLNGSGASGLARQATDRLRRAGFDVVYFGNWGSVTDSSFVVDRGGRMAIARSVADNLGIRTVNSVVDSALFVDATVVLGKDWPPPAVAAEGDWRARLKAKVGR